MEIKFGLRDVRIQTSCLQEHTVHCPPPLWALIMPSRSQCRADCEEEQSNYRPSSTRAVLEVQVEKIRLRGINFSFGKEEGRALWCIAPRAQRNGCCAGGGCWDVCNCFWNGDVCRRSGKSLDGGVACVAVCLYPGGVSTRKVYVVWGVGEGKRKEK